jgi:adenylate cyclase
MRHESHDGLIDLRDRPPLSRRQRWGVWVGASLVTAGLGAAATWVPGLPALERLTRDARFAARGPLQPDPRIVVVEIDETSRRRLLEDRDTRFDVRDHLDDAIRNLWDRGAAAIGVDVWLQGRGDAVVDAALAETIGQANVVLAVAYTDGRLIRAADVFLGGSPDEGCISVEPDPDGVLRRIPALPNLDILQPDGKTIKRAPHFPFVLAWHALAEQAVMAGAPIPEIDIRATGTARIGDRTIRYGEPVNFAAGPGAGFRTLDFADVASGAFEPTAVEGAVVLLGDARSVTDQFRLPIGDKLVPGVYYHANVLDQILSNRALRTWPAGRWAEALLAALVTFGAGLWFWNLRFWHRMRIGWLTLVVYGLAGIAVFVLGWWTIATVAFARGLVLPVAGPMAGIGLAAGLGLTGQLAVAVTDARWMARRNRAIESLFSRNVSPNMLAAIKASPDLVARTEVRDVSVLFCDLRDFTRTTFGMRPEAVAELLNEYYEAITDAAFANDGFIDKFVGDELMVVFGAPLAQPDHASRAAETALGIKARLRALNERRRAGGLPELRCGIGIHCGPAAAGHIGSARRSNYTVVGGTVNAAARIEEWTKGGEVLVSDAVRQRLDATVAIRPWQEVQLRGIEGTSALYELVSRQS